MRKCVCVCVCDCVRKREREREREAGRDRETERFYTERQKTGRETGNRLIGRQTEKRLWRNIGEKDLRQAERRTKEEERQR